MDEQALDRLFSLAKGDGYTKSFEEFKVLMNSNEEAISNMFSLAKGDGYKKDVEEFKTLVGFNAAPVKKKDSSEVISEDQPLVSEQEVGTSDASGVTDQKGIVKPGVPYQGSPEDIESNPMYSDEYKAKFKTEEPIAISSDITTTMSSPLTEIGKAPSKLDKVREEVSLDIYGEELITTGKNTYDFLNTTPESEGILEGTGLPSPNSVNLLLNKEPEKNKDNSYNIDINISKLDIAKEALEARGRTLDDKNAHKFFSEYYRAITGYDGTMPRTTDLGRLSAKSLKDDPEDSKLRASLRESYPTQYSLGIAAANFVTGGGITKGETAQSKENNAYVEAIISTRKKLAELYKQETANAGRQMIEAETISKSGTLSEARETLQADRAEMDSKLIRPEELKASRFLEFAYSKQQLALEEKDPIKKAEYEAESKKWFSMADEDRNNIILNVKINAKKIELKRAQEEGATPGKIRQLDKELNELMESVSADDIYNVRGNETLYNPITGEFISNSKPNSTIRYINDEIDTRLVKYLDTPVGQLKEQVDDLYYRALVDVKTALFGDRQTLISDSKEQGDRLLLKKNSDGELEEYNPRALLEQYDKASNKSLVELLGMGNKIFVGSLGGDKSDVIKASGLKEEDLENYFNYVAITRTIALNEDPGSKNILELKTPYNFFGEALVEGVMGSQETELDQSRRSVEALAKNYNLSENQKEIAAVDLTEQISRGAGSLAPVMIEIGADMFILNKAGGLLKIPKAIEKIAGGSKALKKALDFGYTAAKQGQAFEMAGQGFEAGVGEQLGEGATQLLLDKLGSKNIISKVLLRVLGGAVGETSGEYMGEVFDRYIAKDEELMDAISNTIGSPETAKEKATVTFLLSLLMSGTMAPFSISQDIKQERIDYLKSDRGSSEMIDQVLKIAEEGGDGSEYFEPLRKEAEKRIRERAETESKESGQDIVPDLSSESIMGEITAMIEADGQTGVNINEYRRTSKDEKNPEVKKLKEQIEGLRDEDGLIPQDKKTELDRLNKAIAEVEAQPTSEVEAKEAEIEEKSNLEITPENSSNYANMTEDGEGNFVFYHKGAKDYETIKPSASSDATSKAEAAATRKVGGVSMYYTSESDGEAITSGREAKYMVRVPKEKVYDANTDNLGLAKEAKERHAAEYPGQGYDANTERAYMTKIAAEKGFDMIVGDWDGKTRAQTTKEMTPSDVMLIDGNTVTQKFKEEFEDNKKKGYESFIPETKTTALDAFYKKLNKERNKEGTYDDIYRLTDEASSKSQEQISKEIEESDISQELKDEYKAILDKKYDARKSSRNRTDAVTVDNSPKGAFVNVGMIEGNDGREMSETEIEAHLPEGVTVKTKKRIEIGQGVDEPTLSMELSRPLTDSEMITFREGTNQIAIPQIVDGQGTMHGTTEWGDFNPEYFITPEGKKLSEVASTTQKRGESLATEFKEMEASKKDTSKIEEQVENAKKAIAKVSPKTKIVVHKTAKDYKNSGKNRKQNEGGEYDIEKDTIHINLESANERTIAHEVFHALLLNKGMNDKQAKSVTDNMLKAVKKTASPELLARLEEFSGRYESALQSEESIAELFGILAAGYPTLPKPTQNIIKRWLDKLAKLFGLKMFTDNEVVDMLNVVSKKVKEGVEISEKELKPIRKKVDIEKEFEGGIPVDELTDADMNQNQTSQWGGGRSQINTIARKQIFSKASSAEMFENPEILKPKREANGRTKVIELGRAFDKRAKDNGYYIPIPKNGVYTDSQLNKIAEAMTDDAQLQLLQDDSGIGWYDLKTRSAMELMSRIHPELSDSNSKPHLEFTLMVALISQNNSVGINFRQANEAYTYYKNNNKLPNKPYAGKSGNIIKQNIALAFEAIKKKGWENYKNILQETKTVKEWEAEGYKINGENKTTKITGAMAMLGSKIGSFWGNLNGDFNTLTADLWFSRMFNRYTGNVVSKKATEKSKQTTLDELKKYKGKTLLNGYKKSDILKGGKVFDKWLNTIVKDYADGGYKDKQRLNIVSNTHFKNTKGELQDIPRGGKERNTMRNVVKRVQDKLIERGYPELDIADIQAIVWYNEKDLYRQYKAVNKSSEKTDYETAAQEVLREQGVNAEVALPFKTSKSSADGGRKQTDRIQPKSLSEKVEEPTTRSRKQIVGLQGKSPKEVVSRVRKQKGLINVSEKEVLKYSRAGIESQYDAQAIKQIGLQGVKFNKASIQEKIKEEFDSLIDKADTYVISEDSKAVDGAIQFEISALENDGASLNSINNAKKALEPGSMRDAFIDKYKSTQKETIDQWKSYLSESDYNDSFKYLILDAILTNNYDFKTDKYTKRTSKTIRNFTPFDAGTLAALYASDSKKLLKDYVEIQAQNTNNIVESSSYVSTSEGEWVKFEGGQSVSNEVRQENANKLSQMVQNTYWCTKTNAKSQLDDGDFYVYATKNKDGEYESRVAVRMEGDKVGEVRGNASSKQDLEPEMLPVADKFLKENIPNNSGKKWLDSIEYNTRVKDLTDKIDGKVVDEKSLQEYLEIIKDSGKFKVDYGENGLVTKLKDVFKDSKFDFSVARNLRELRPNTVLFIGDFEPLKEVQSKLFPKYVTGDARFRDSQVTDLGSLQSIGGYADFGGSQITDLGNLQSIGEDALFGGSQITDLGNLQSIGEDARFGDSQVTDLGNLQSIGGYVDFGNSQITDLGSLQSIGEDADFGDSQITDLGNLQSIGGYADFGYSQITDLGSLQSIGGDADFRNSQVTDLGSLQSIGRDAFFGGSQITDLGNLQSIGEDARFGDKQNLKEEFNRRQSEQTRVRKQLPADDLTKIEAVRKLAQEKGYTEAELKVALEKLGFSKAEINSTKEKSITDAQEKFDTSIKRGNTKADAVKSALGDLKSTTWYSITTDTKRDAAVKELKKSLGEKIEKAPSTKKVLGVKKKKVTVDEMAALKSQIKLEAKAARESVKAYKDASKKIITYIKQLQKTGVITNAQSSSMIKKVLSTNMLNDKMVSRLEAYISKIYTKAELAEKISRARKLRKTAIKNIKSKVGPSRDLLQTLRDLFSVDPSLIPLNKIDAYLDILTQFGERSAVLKLKEAGEVMDSASDILSSIEEVDKVDLDKVSLPNKLNEEIEADLDGYLKGIISNKIEFENVQEGDAKDLAMFLNSLTSSDLELLIKEKKDGTKDYSMLEKLREVKSNITNGYVPALANSIRNTVKAKRSESKIRGVVEKTKKYNILTGFSRVYGKVKGAITGKTGLTEAIRGTMTTAIDDILGNFNSKTIYNNVILPLAQAFSAYQADMSKNVDAKLDLADSLLYKTKIPSIQRLTNAVQKSKYKIQAYRLQREFESNPDSKQVATAVDFIDATIEAISFNEAGRRLNQRDIKILKEIKKEFSEGGQISLSKIEDSLSKNEKKALKLIDEAADMEAKALWTATVIRGVGMKPINNYVHHNIIPKNDTAESDNVLKGSNKMSKPSTNAGTLRERTPGAKAINFDPISSTSSGARETLLDYHMTDAVKVVNAAVKGVKYTGDLTKDQQDAINAIDNIKNELLDNVFKAQFVSETSFGGVLKGIQKLGYAAALASVPRAGAELGSNLTYAFTQPQAFLGGVKNFGGLVLGAEGMNAMDNLGSTETMRLYDTDVMTSKMVDSNILHTSAPKAKKTAHSIVDKASFIYQMGPKQLKALTTFVADKLISTPDKAVSRPFWFGAFALSFKKSTGISLTKKDMQEVADGTSKYLSEEYKDAREKATKYADQEVIKMASSNNPFNTVLKNVVSPNDAGYTKIYKAANSYMSTFMMNEYATARNAVLSLFKQGDLSKAQSVATLSGLIIRMGSYMVLYSVLRSAFDSLFGYEDEDEEELSDLALRQFIGAPITLITGRGLGQIPRLLVNFGVEQVNENYLEGLRDGKDYDPYKHSLVFSQVSEDNLKNKTPEENLIKMFAGPYSPLLSSGSRFVKVVTRSITSKKQETKDKYKKELEDRMTIEAMGNLGFLPFYKDIRRMILKDLFKGYNEPKKKKKKYNWRISG